MVANLKLPEDYFLQEGNSVFIKVPNILCQKNPEKDQMTKS